MKSKVSVALIAAVIFLLAVGFAMVQGFVSASRYMDYEEIRNALYNLQDTDIDNNLGLVYDFLGDLPDSEKKDEVINAFEDVLIAFGKYQDTALDIANDIEDRLSRRR